MPIQPGNQWAHDLTRLVELLNEFKQARADLDGAQQEQAKVSNLGTEANQKWESLLRDRPELSSESPSQYVPEQREIERIYENRDKARARIGSIWWAMQPQLDRFRTPETSERFKVLDLLSPQLGLHTTDRAISLVEDFLATQAQVETTTSAGQGGSAESQSRTPIPAGRSISPIQCPPGAAWNDVSIRFLSEHRVEIKVRGVVEIRNYVEMGFEDRRKQTPRSAWTTLTQFAKLSGVIRIPSEGKSKNWPSLEKRVQFINQTLRELFGIGENPILYDRGEKGYRTGFTVTFPGADVL